jgi:hypothetical protein
MLIANAQAIVALVSRYSNNMPDQCELIPIEQVQEYDQVWSCDSLSDRWQPKTVFEVLTHQYAGDIITIEIENGLIETTGGHPIWAKSGNDLVNRPRCEHIYDDEHEIQPHGRWVNARDLQIGDELISRSSSSHILRIQSRSEMTTVYNITVADYHTYAVGSGEFLVHNKAMKNKYDDEGFGYRGGRRDAQNSKMKSSHQIDKADMDYVANEAKMNRAQRRAFHEKILSKVKDRGERLDRSELLEMAMEFMQQ